MLEAISNGAVVAVSYVLAIAANLVCFTRVKLAVTFSGRYHGSFGSGGCNLSMGRRHDQPSGSVIGGEFM